MAFSLGIGCDCCAPVGDCHVCFYAVCHEFPLDGALIEVYDPADGDCTGTPIATGYGSVCIDPPMSAVYPVRVSALNFRTRCHTISVTCPGTSSHAIEMAVERLTLYLRACVEPDSALCLSSETCDTFYVNAEVYFGLATLWSGTIPLAWCPAFPPVPTLVDVPWPVENDLDDAQISVYVDPGATSYCLGDQQIEINVSKCDGYASRDLTISEGAGLCTFCCIKTGLPQILTYSDADGTCVCTWDPDYQRWVGGYVKWCDLVGYYDPDQNICCLGPGLARARIQVTCAEGSSSGYRFRVEKYFGASIVSTYCAGGEASSDCWPLAASYGCAGVAEECLYVGWSDDQECDPRAIVDASGSTSFDIGSCGYCSSDPPTCLSPGAFTITGSVR
jgi:hypothetical protein